jgi:hypothetical protein
MITSKVLGADLNYTELFAPAPSGTRVRTHTSTPPVQPAQVSQRTAELVLHPDLAILFSPVPSGRLVRLHVYDE